MNPTPNREPSMPATRRFRKLTPGENNRLLGLAVGYLLGQVGVLVSLVAVVLGRNVRGLGADHWVLWVLWVTVVLVVILLVALTVFFTRLRPRAEDSTE